MKNKKKLSPKWQAYIFSTQTIRNIQRKYSQDIPHTMLKIAATTEPKECDIFRYNVSYGYVYYDIFQEVNNVDFS
jgi:hypothetical protein